MKIGSGYVADIDYALIEREGATIEFLPSKIEGNSVNIFSYGIQTCEGLKPQLKSGAWISERTDGVSECVVIGNKYKIGDTFSEKVGNKTFSFFVTGSLGKTATVISSSRSSSAMRADMLFYEYDSNKNGTAVICCSSEVIDASGTYGNAFVFGSTEAVCEHLLDTGNVFSMAEIRNNSDEELSLKIKSFLPLAICFAIMGLIATVGMVCMNLLGNKRITDVYFTCGMSRKESVLLTLGYMCGIVFAEIIVSAVIYLVCRLAFIDNSVYQAKINNYIFSDAFLMFEIVVSVLISLITIKPSDVSER